MWEKTTLLLPDPWRALRVFDHLSHGTVGPGRSGEVSASRRCALAELGSHVFFDICICMYTVYTVCVYGYIYIYTFYMYIQYIYIYDIYCILYYVSICILYDVISYNIIYVYT